MTDHLYLVDGSAFIYRAYHALPPLTRKSDGLPVGAVSGYCNMLFKLLDNAKGEFDHTHFAVIFDAGGKTFRHKIYADYKGNRPTPPAELRNQFALVRDATRAFGVASLERSGFEADDLIATLVRRARAADMLVTIVSSDKDLMQLVGDDVDMLDTMQMKRIDRAGVRAKFGVLPEQVIDVQALAGDVTDNVPGVPSIGIKTAAELINQFGRLENLLARVDEIKQPKRRSVLKAFADQARLSRQLVALDDTVPLDCPIDLLVRQPIDVPTLSAFCVTMEFHTLRQAIEGNVGMKLGVTGDQPTDIYEAFAWWRDALAGLAPPIHSEPRCGFYARKMVRDGPLVPVAIWIEQDIDEGSATLRADEQLMCALGGKEADPFKEWSYAAGRPISEAEYKYLIAEADWSREYAPNNPSAQPHKKIDPLSIDPVF